jgi:hypothetical protein
VDARQSAIRRLSLITGPAACGRSRSATGGWPTSGIADRLDARGDREQRQHSPRSATTAARGADPTTPCPCGNNGLPGNGCGHSFDPNGANLTATGTAPADDVLLTSSFEPATSFTLFMQHDAAGDVVFHDGVLCAGGTLIRLRGRGAVGGQAFFPNPVWTARSRSRSAAR